MIIGCMIYNISAHQNEQSVPGSRRAWRGAAGPARAARARPARSRAAGTPPRRPAPPPPRACQTIHLNYFVMF